MALPFYNRCPQSVPFLCDNICPYSVLIDALILFPYSAMTDAFSLFHGWKIYTWMLVLTQAVTGLIMSAIFKHGNNITRLFVISCAMLVTTVLSMIIFNLQLNVFFCIAFVLILVALTLYHKH